MGIARDKSTYSSYGAPSCTTRNHPQHIYLWSGGAFSALKEDGSVVTWGDTTWGGDSSQVKDQLLSRWGVWIFFFKNNMLFFFVVWKPMHQTKLKGWVLFFCRWCLDDVYLFLFWDDFFQGVSAVGCFFLVGIVSPISCRGPVVPFWKKMPW